MSGSASVLGMTWFIPESEDATPRAPTPWSGRGADRPLPNNLRGVIEMRRASVVIAAGVAAGIVGLSTGPASAWDCIRVSGSQQGLMNSTSSGNWEYMNLDDLMAGAADAGVTEEQAQCVAEHWRADGRAEYFAIGIGVAGARGAITSGHITDEDFFVLAKNAPVNVTSDGHGVDHLETVLNGYLGDCGVQPPADEH